MERKREGEKGGGRGKEGKEQRNEIKKPKQAWKEGHKKTGDKPEKRVCFYQESRAIFSPSQFQ